MKYVKISGVSVGIHTGDYGCCDDCAARLEADDAVGGPDKRKAARDVRP